MFESNIDFEIRFMVDRKIKGASWVTLPKGKYGPRLQANESTCSYNCVIDYKYEYIYTLGKIHLSQNFQKNIVLLLELFVYII